MRLFRAGALLILALVAVCGLAGRASATVCHRPAEGSVVTQPADLYSSNGTLAVTFNFVTSTDGAGRTLYCFVTPAGLENPTLHVNPGDSLTVVLTNTLRANAADAAVMAGMAMGHGDAAKVCGDAEMLPGTVNLHFHGMNVSPTCGSDEVIHTLVNPGSTFTYRIDVPANEPPGMYWYHPHIHGVSHQLLEGGASGMIEVEGIQSVVPPVAGLPQRFLIMRDQTVVGVQGPSLRQKPNLDVTLNAVPISWPEETPAVLETQAGRREFWRVVNASSDNIAMLQLRYDGHKQPMTLVALDGVPIGSQDGGRSGRQQSVTTLLIPPAGRAEFIMTAPSAGVREATLVTLKPDNGPFGDVTPTRTIGRLAVSGSDAQTALKTLAAHADAPLPQRFEGLDDAQVTATRNLYFSEIITDPGGGDEGLFYITVRGRVPKLFDPDAPPSITTTQGAVEDWTIENRTSEVHEFHMHQIHYQLRAINGQAVAAADRQIRDTIQIPYWTGHGPYPSVTLRMDFRGAVVGDFVYHCHILDHEDLGMMAIVRVLPKG